MLAIVLASLLWGTTGTAATLLPASVPPLAAGAATMGVGGALLFAVSARRSTAVLRDAGARRELLLGAAGVVTYPLAFYSSMAYAGVAVGNVVSLGSAPVFAALLEWAVDRRPLSRRWLLSTALAVSGVAVLGLAGDEGRSDAALAPLGVVLGLVAGLSYALYTAASSRVLGRGHGSSAVMGAVFGLGAVPLLVVLLVVGGPLVAGPGPVAVAAYLAVGPMFAAYLLFGRGLRTVPASTATTLTLLEPLVATVLAVVVVGERLPPVGWAGLAAILAGVTVLTVRRARRRST